MLLLLATVLLLSALTCGCEENMTFDSEDDMKKLVIGTWTSDSDSDTYYVFTNNDYRAYSFNSVGMDIAFSTSLNEVKSGDDPIEGINFNSFLKSFRETWLKRSSSLMLTWKYKKGAVSTYKDTFSVTEDGSLRRKSDDAILTKLSDDVNAYEKKWNTAAAGFSDQFAAEQKKAAFNKLYSDLPSGMDVQYNKIGHLGKHFKITGKAKLDDYYNWDYRGLEGVYFCIKIRPDLGTYSNEWYIYGSRSTHKDLYDKLMSNPGSSVTLICTLYFFDTGINNMATLVDYIVN